MSKVGREARLGRPCGRVAGEVRERCGRGAGEVHHLHGAAALEAQALDGARGGGHIDARRPHLDCSSHEAT